MQLLHINPVRCLDQVIETLPHSGLNVNLQPAMWMIPEIYSWRYCFAEWHYTTAKHQHFKSEVIVVREAPAASRCDCPGLWSLLLSEVYFVPHNNTWTETNRMVVHRCG